MPRAVTAYFAFADANRAAVREELQAAAEPNAKISVAVVAQALGKKWKALDDAEKDTYKQLAAERTMVAAEAEAAAAAVAKAARGSSPDGDAQRDGSAEPDRAAADDRAPDPAEPAALPISVVKRIMSLDDDISRASASAVRAVAVATELWLAKVAERALAVAIKGKRKTLKFSDIQMVAAKDKRLGEIGLQEIYDHEGTFAEARGEGDLADENGDPRPPKKARKEATPDAKARQITSFFGGGAKQAQPETQPDGDAVLQSAEG